MGDDAFTQLVLDRLGEDWCLDSMSLSFVCTNSGHTPLGGIEMGVHGVSWLGTYFPYARIVYDPFGLTCNVTFMTGSDHEAEEVTEVALDLVNLIRGDR